MAASDTTKAANPALTARHDTPQPIDLRLTLAPLRHGRDDPTIGFEADGVWLARMTAAGPTTIRLATDGRTLTAAAWGPGAESALQAVPDLAGLNDRPELLTACHALVHELERQFPGLRLPRTGQLLPALVPAVIEQKVTGSEAHAAYLALARRLGKPAPGPMPLLLPPTPAQLAALPYFEFHPLGLERRRADLIRRISSRAGAIEALIALPADAARDRLQSIPGIGPWTAAEATRTAFGDPDAVSLGDAHIPDLVAWALAGEARADDARMLELLEPYRGQRARVVRLLEVAGIKIPRFGPRFAPGRITSI